MTIVQSSTGNWIRFTCPHCRKHHYYQLDGKGRKINITACDAYKLACNRRTRNG